MQTEKMEQKAQRAAEWIMQADSLLITAGAGMGIDSGLPDFRGPQGFYKAYPALKSDRIGFQDIANGQAFIEMPERAWGFYGHRLQLYRDTVPHAGFEILHRLALRMPTGHFIYTSNVDGQFQKAGFAEESIVECHGSIHYLQCVHACTTQIWPAEDVAMEIDEQGRARPEQMPHCPHCGRLARPNILMFNDWSWIEKRTELQNYWFERWRKAAQNMVVIEIGAGTAIPTARRKGEQQGAPLIRINPDATGPDGARLINLPVGALAALTLIERHLLQRGY